MQTRQTSPIWRCFDIKRALGLGYPAPAFLVGDIVVEAQGSFATGAEIGGKPRGLFMVEVGQDHLGALARKKPRARSPDAARGTSDKCHLAVDPTRTRRLGDGARRHRDVVPLWPGAFLWVALKSVARRISIDERCSRVSYR